MIITSYHEVVSLKLHPTQNLPAPDSVTWRVLEVETAQGTHMINFFPESTQSQLQLPASIPNIELLGTNQTRIQVDDKEYFYSYRDCVGFRQGQTRIVRDDHHSLTTKKHIANMCKSFTKVSPAEFYYILNMPA